MSGKKGKLSVANSSLLKPNLPAVKVAPTSRLRFYSQGFKLLGNRLKARLEKTESREN
jgi:hypothetical protein